MSVHTQLKPMIHFLFIVRPFNFDCGDHFFRLIDFSPRRVDSLHSRRRRPIRPFGNRNYKLGNRLRAVAELGVQRDW